MTRSVHAVGALLLAAALAAVAPAGAQQLQNPTPSLSGDEQVLVLKNGGWVSTTLGQIAAMNAFDIVTSRDAQGRITGYRNASVGQTCTISYDGNGLEATHVCQPK